MDLAKNSIDFHASFIAGQCQSEMEQNISFCLSFRSLEMSEH